MNASQREAAYSIIQSVFNRLRTVNAGVDQLHEQLSLNRSSARYLIEVYKNLRNGTVFKRALSAGDMNYFMETIAQEGGRQGLSAALQALRLHVGYRERSGVKQLSNRAILELHSRPP
jgi:5-methylcytosine-specific restriction enzyme A